MSRRDFVLQYILYARAAGRHVEAEYLIKEALAAWAAVDKELGAL
jgi:hypothetical protein